MFFFALSCPAGPGESSYYSDRVQVDVRQSVTHKSVEESVRVLPYVKRVMK